MKKYFDRKNKRLVVIGQLASAQYWDNLWNSKNFSETVKRESNNKLVINYTKKFITPGKDKKILEGGCGKGQLVYSLQNKGYDVYGVDYAKNTVNKIKEAFPELKVSYGDVTRLDFPDNFFDGYWSRGVIEHFYKGYDPMIKEMARVIKPGGYIFLTFPVFSPIRKLKALFKKYPDFNEKEFNNEKFYQFILDNKDVENYIEAAGFKFICRKKYNGMLGACDEFYCVEKILKKIKSSNNWFLKILRYSLKKIIPSVIFAHSILLIFKKS